jgi:hypothetical protein
MIEPHELALRHRTSLLTISKAMHAVGLGGRCLHLPRAPPIPTPHLGNGEREKREIFSQVRWIDVEV